MTNDKPLVYVIDDDAAVRESLGLLLESLRLANEVYGSALEFLDAYDPGRHSCLVTDIRMPAMSGLELQQKLAQDKAEIPIIFITGHADVPMAVSAMKAGASDFLRKPFRDQDLLDCIHKALWQDRERRVLLQEEATIRACLKTLTPRELEVMQRVVSGQANKVIAIDLDISARTVELHRARVMQKLGMRSLAELVRTVDKASNAQGVNPPTG
ncbi:MAG: response regulator [Nitrococcus sp.]|nr:response regulator [Nitrococcus sp.]